MGVKWIVWWKASFVWTRCCGFPADVFTLAEPCFNLQQEIISIFFRFKNILMKVMRQCVFGMEDYSVCVCVWVLKWTFLVRSGDHAQNGESVVTNEVRQENLHIKGSEQEPKLRIITSVHPYWMASLSVLLFLYLVSLNSANGQGNLFKNPILCGKRMCVCVCVCVCN